MKGWRVPVCTVMFLLGGCSYLPFFGSGGPHLTNDAVAACERKARDLDYSGIGEHQSTPAAEGRYTVVLDVLTPNGYGTVTCSYDPQKGADLPPPPKRGG